MTTLAQFLVKASEKHWAVPHFNVSNIEQLRGVCEAARKLGAPLMIGASEGEREYIGLTAIVGLVREYSKEFGVPLFLNADHTKSVAAAKKAIDAGFESIHIDLSKKPWKENVAGTSEVVRYAKKKNRNINVEGELGYLVTDSSKIYKERFVIPPESLTKPEEAKKFVAITGVDRFAPAVGNLHGIAANRKKINFELIKKIRAAVPKNVALVLHGGSGNSPAVFQKAIKLGFANIHISTELRIAYAAGLKNSIKIQPDELAPYKIGAPAIASVQKKAEKFIKIFGADHKI